MSNKTILVIRKSTNLIYAQIVIYDIKGDKTITSVSTKALIKLGYTGKLKNTPSAYLLGLLIAKKAKEKSINTAIPDIGFHRAIRGSIVFTVIKGAKDGGLKINYDELVSPSEGRIKGEHIANYKKDMKDLSKNIDEVKNKLLEK